MTYKEISLFRTDYEIKKNMMDSFKSMKGLYSDQIYQSKVVKGMPEAQKYPVTKEIYEIYSTKIKGMRKLHFQKDLQI